MNQMRFRGAVARTQDRRVASCLALLTAAILLPAVLFPIPPILDYPNHLARIWLITSGVHTPPMSSFYFEDWSHVGSGIGIDLMAKAFGGLAPPFAIGFVLLVLAMLLPPFGAIALNARVHGGLNSWQPFFLFFWCSHTFVAGFLNFQIGLGAALVAAAIDANLLRRGPWTLYPSRFALGLLLIIIHPFALLFYSTLLAALAFGNDKPVTRSDIVLRLRRATIAAASSLPAVVLFFMRVRGVPGTDDKLSGLVTFSAPLEFLRAIASPFSTYDVKVDLLFALAFTTVIIIGLLKRGFAIHFGLLTLAAIFVICAPFMPKLIGHTAWMSNRLPLIAILTALSATQLTIGTCRTLRMLAVAVVLVGLRTAWIGLNWNAAAPMIEAMRHAVADVPPGSKVLAMQHQNFDRDGFFAPLGRTVGTQNEAFRHFPALMIPWRHAYTPMLFAQYREKPILVRPPYDRISDPTGGALPSVHALRNQGLLDKRTQYIRRWRENFDYVLVLNADRPDVNGPFEPPADLILVTDEGFAQLFLVRKVVHAVFHPPTAGRHFRASHTASG